MNHHPSLREIKSHWHGTFKAYAIGFFGSLALTGISFLLVVTETLSGENLILALVGLALTQALLQLLFFLHLGQEARPRWETAIFFFMVLILLIIVLGSLWIMNDLNARMMEM